MSQAISQPTHVTGTQSSSPVKTMVLIIGALFLIGLFGVWAVNLQDLKSADLQGQPAPEFTLPLFDMFEEDSISLSDLQGQIVVVNFWASWCVQCYDEAPLLEQAWRDYKDQGVMFVGVDHLDTDKPALEYMKRYDITYPSGPDVGDKISQAYAITGVPETFFIDQSGTIVHVQIGPINRVQLYGILDKLVKPQGL